MKTQISPMLAVSDPVAAIDFYERAFGAVVRWCVGEPAAVAGLSIDGAEFFLAEESATNPRSPDSVGHTSVRIELFVNDPEGVQAKALAAGAVLGNPVELHEHLVVGSSAPMHMLQGGLVDPFGHIWLIGKFLD